MNIRESKEYAVIKAVYGDTKAARSGVPYIHHIHEGLAIIEEVVKKNWVTCNVLNAQKAYCMHPVVQNDANLKSSGLQYADQTTGLVMLLAMEYRQRANEWLSDKVRVWEEAGTWHETFYGSPYAGDIPEVKAMLIADKVQNRKDFEKYLKGKHPRSADLALYFERWLDVLGIGENRYECLKTVAMQVTK